MQEQRLGDFAKYAKMSEKAATSSGTWDRSRKYWDITSRWYALLQDPENQKRAQMSIAETYVSQSNTAIAKPPASYMVAALHLQKAIEAYRRLGGMKEKIEELHKLLLEYQTLSMQEMKMSFFKIDTRGLVKQVIAQVKGKSFKDVIIQLALMSASSRVDSLRLQVEEAFRNYPLQFMTAETLSNETGKVIGRKPSIIPNDPDESETAFQIYMHKYALHHRSLTATAIVEPALHQINLENNVSIEDFEFIVMNNPFIPPGREMIYAKGLLEGLRGDFLVSTHLLIPQIEHSIRYLMEQQGFIVSGLDDRGIQDEHNINALIRRPELVEILGEDIVFDLKGLLVHRFGNNLRNGMAHGLVDYNNFFSYENSYLWWLTLRLCCLPIIKLD
ncbi:MAG: DUF4209 domain-containing protein [Spirulinaceae cyanobacterium]